MKALAWTATTLLVLGLAGRSLGDEEKPQTKGSVPIVYTPPSFSQGAAGKALLGRLAGFVVITSLVAIGLVWAAKRWGRPGGALPVGKAGALQVEESLRLGNGCALHLLRVDDFSFLAGTDPTGLKTLAALQTPFEDLLEGTNGDTDYPLSLVPPGNQAADDER